MVLEVKNLGPIKDAKIDLNKPMTVFCGPNNTGKTYLSYIIYALIKQVFFNIPLNLPKEIFQKLKEKGEVEYEISLDSLKQSCQRLAVAIKENLNSIFGISKDKTEKYFNELELKIDENDDELINSTLKIGYKIYRGSQFMADKKRGSLKILLRSGEKSSETFKDEDEFNVFIMPHIYKLILIYPFTNAVMFPVERNSINIFSKELSINRNNVIEQIQELPAGDTKDVIKLVRNKTNRYSLPIRDNLAIAEDLANLRNEDSDFKDFGEEIERELLSGEVTISDEGEMEFISSHAKTKKIPVHISASIVKTLSGLVFYLKHLAKKGDLIIIDEPELNLHPDQQVKLVRVFAKMINKGFRFLISTHSDYIIKEINNLIMLSDDSESVKNLMEQLRYTEDEKIKSSEVNAYYFNYNNKDNVIVESQNVDKYGFEAPSIDAVINKINGTAEELYYAVKYPEDNANQN